MALAGKDYCVVAADTRMSQGYEILTRSAPKATPLTSKAVFAAGGMSADRTAFQRMLKFELAQYEAKMGREMSTQALAQLVSTRLYHRRFFPYYAFILLAGLDEDGVGCVYGYDAVGSFERSTCGVQGSGVSLIQPVLDNQRDLKNHTAKPDHELSSEEMVDLIKDAFASAGERDIYTGDDVDIYVIKADGITHEVFPLNKD